MSDLEFKALEFSRQRKETEKKYSKELRLIYVSLMIIALALSGKRALARTVAMSETYSVTTEASENTDR